MRVLQNNQSIFMVWPSVELAGYLPATLIAKFPQAVFLARAVWWFAWLWKLEEELWSPKRLTVRCRNGFVVYGN